MCYPGCDSTIYHAFTNAINSGSRTDRWKRRHSVYLKKESNSQGNKIEHRQFMHLLIAFAVFAGQYFNVECIWALQNYELLSCCRILIPELAKYEQEETSCSVPAVRTRMQMTCWPMRRQQHGTLTNQRPETQDWSFVPQHLFKMPVPRGWK